MSSISHALHRGTPHPRVELLRSGGLATTDAKLIYPTFCSSATAAAMPKSKSMHAFTAVTLGISQVCSASFPYQPQISQECLRYFPLHSMSGCAPGGKCRGEAGGCRAHAPWRGGHRWRRATAAPPAGSCGGPPCPGAPPGCCCALLAGQVLPAPAWVLPARGPLTLPAAQSLPGLFKPCTMFRVTVEIHWVPETRPDACRTAFLYITLLHLAQSCLGLLRQCIQLQVTR